MAKDKYQEVQDYCAKKYKQIITKGKKDIGDFYLNEKYPVNVKSNNLDANNYSPNIISAKRLLSWLKEPTNQYGLIFVDYKIVKGKIQIIKDSDVIQIEHISWDCLSIEAQGWGVIQKVGELKLNKRQSRKQFLLGFEKEYKKFKAKEEKKWRKMDELLTGVLKEYA